MEGRDSIWGDDYRSAFIDGLLAEVYRGFPQL